MQIRIFRQLFVLGITLTTALSCFAQSPELVGHFDYDKSAPLNIKTIRTEKRGDVTVYDITYASPKGGFVPAYLVVPKGKGPFAAVVWGHWYWQNRCAIAKNFSKKRSRSRPQGLCRC